MCFFAIVIPSQKRYLEKNIFGLSCPVAGSGRAMPAEGLESVMLGHGETGGCAAGQGVTRGQPGRSLCLQEQRGLGGGNGVRDPTGTREGIRMGRFEVAVCRERGRREPYKGGLRDSVIC